MILFQSITVPNAVGQQISLSGIVVRNGIVLIDFIEKSRTAGVELKEAVLRGGEARLRPILLTSTTAVAGLSPLALFGQPAFRAVGDNYYFRLGFFHHTDAGHSALTLHGAERV